MNGSNSPVMSRDYVTVVLGLMELGILKDPFMEKYRNAGKLLSEGGEEGMSIPGLVSLANKKLYDGKIPNQGMPCHVPIYRLKKNGWKHFPGALRILVEEGVLTKKIVDEIIELPEYQEKVCQ